ncbi:hypothetical protein Tco_1353944 [Tanacetum coccineum]
MSSSTHPITILSDSNVEDAFSSTNTLDYTLASPNYFPASPGNTPSDSSDDLTKYLLASLAISPFYDDLYMKVMQAYDTTNNESPIPLPQAPIAPPTVFPPSSVNMALLPTGFLKPLYPDIVDMRNDQDIKHTISPTPPSDYPLMSYLSGRGMKLLESEPVPEKPNELDAFVFFIGVLAYVYQAACPPIPKKLGPPDGLLITSPRIKLRDGRYLSYKEYGVANESAKYKIIYVHAFNAVKHDTVIATTTSPALIETMGIYIVQFDRPDKWSLRVAHHLPSLTYWWNTQKWSPIQTVIARSPYILSSQDRELVPNFIAGRAGFYQQARQQREFESIHRDLRTGFGTWDFDLMDIDNPFTNHEACVHVWQGDEDFNITDIKYVLTQKGLDIFCHKFHIPEDVHPQLPSPNQTIHEMPVGKIGVYTRFFEYDNFRLPLSTFLILCRVHNIEPTVGLFRCFYVNSKNKGWMSFSKRSDSDAVCYTKPLDSLKHWNDHFFWVESFACPASFPWHTDKNVSRDPFPKSTEFNADDYVVLVVHPTLFWKFPEPFLCLVGISRYYTLDKDTYPKMDLSTYIHVVDPTKVKVVERERAEGEEKLLESIIGRVVPLLPVAPARSEVNWRQIAAGERPKPTYAKKKEEKGKRELEASVDKLFDEGGSTDQGDSAAGGGHDAEIELVTGVENIASENVIAERPKHLRKKRQAVTDASGSSHPPKKLKGDHGTSSGAATGDKSPSALKELLASNILNVKVGVEAVATLPLVISSVSTTPRREGGNPTDSITGLNLRTVGPSERYVVLPPVMTEAVVTSHAASDPPIPVPEMGTKITSLVHASMFHDSDSTKTVRADVAGPSYSAKQDLLMGSRELNTETLHQFNVGTARQACLNAGVRMQTEYCLSETSMLESECKKQADLLKARDDEIENLKAQLLLKEAEATEAVRLCAQYLELKDLNVVVSSLKSQNDVLVDQVHALKTTCFSLRDQVFGYERLKEKIEEFQDAQMNIVNDKVAKLDADLLEMALHLEERFYPHVLTTISGRRWLLTRNLKLVVVKCLISPEYLTALGSAISHAIEKGMQSGLSAGIDHEKAGRSLEDVVAYNPAAETDFNSSLQRLREVDFPLLTKLSSHKYESAADIMDLLRLESPLADAPGMSDLQPDVKQLTFPIHRPEDQVVLSETSLSFALSVAHSRVENIRENIVAHLSALIDVWVLLVDSLSTENLIGTSSTSGNVLAVVMTTIALSTTFAPTSSVPPITTYDYEIVSVRWSGRCSGECSGKCCFFPHC